MYNFWKKQHNIKFFNVPEEFRGKLESIKKINVDNRRILDIEYFIYPFYLISIGCISGAIVFIFEIFWSYILRLNFANGVFNILKYNRAL